MSPASTHGTMVDYLVSLQLGQDSKPFMILHKLSNILAGYPWTLLLVTPAPASITHCRRSLSVGQSAPLVALDMLFIMIILPPLL